MEGHSSTQYRSPSTLYSQRERSILLFTQDASDTWKSLRYSQISLPHLTSPHLTSLARGISCPPSICPAESGHPSRPPSGSRSLWKFPRCPRGPLLDTIPLFVSLAWRAVCDNVLFQVWTDQYRTEWTLRVVTNCCNYGWAMTVWAICSRSF